MWHTELRRSRGMVLSQQYYVIEFVISHNSILLNNNVAIQDYEPLICQAGDDDIMI